MSTETPLDEILSAFHFRKTEIAYECFECFINQMVIIKGFIGEKKRRKCCCFRPLVCCLIGFYFT